MPDHDLSALELRPPDLPTPDLSVLAYIHNNPPHQADSVVAPIAAALRAAWDGEVVVASIREVDVRLGTRPFVRIAGRNGLPARTYARIFNPTYGPALGRSLRSLGSRVLNDPDAVSTAVTKFESAAALHAAGVPVPDQVLFTSSPSRAQLAAHDELGWPRVIKANLGRGGESVWLAHTVADIHDLAGAAPRDEDAARAGRLEVDLGPAQPWVAQQFRRDAAGTDVRVLVVAGTVCAAMERRAADANEFRANITLGGSAHAVDITDLEAAVAKRAAAALGLVVAGVDILRTDDGPLVTEVNPNPALNAIADLVGHDVVYRTVAHAIVTA